MRDRALPNDDCDCFLRPAGTERKYPRASARGPRPPGDVQSRRDGRTKRGNASSFVPDGTCSHAEPYPTDKSVGYFRTSLRDSSFSTALPSRGMLLCTPASLCSTIPKNCAVSENISLRARRSQGSLVAALRPCDSQIRLAMRQFHAFMMKFYQSRRAFAIGGGG